MDIYPWLSLASCIFCAVLGLGVVHRLNSKKTLNKLFLATTLSGTYWIFTEFMMWQSNTYETAYFWNKMGFLWPLFPAFVLHFSLFFTESSWLKSKITYVLIYLPAALFALLDITTELVNGSPTLHFWGWEDTLPNPPFVGYISDFWTALLPIMSLVICALFTFRIVDRQKKLQSEFVTLGFSIPIAVYLITNIVFPLVNVELPNLGHISVLAFGILVAFAIFKYELFSFDAALAADNIISIMPNPLVLADLNGRIFKVNRRFIELFGFTEKEIVGHHISEFAKDLNRYSAILNELKEKRGVSDLEVKIATKTGQIKNISLSCSIVLSKTRKPLGFTCILHDVTYLKETEEKLANSKSYLETITNSMLSGLLIIDGITHTIIDANDAALKMVGKSREELLGKTCHQSMCPSEKGKCPITDLGLNVEHKERILLDSNGNPKHVLKNVVKIMADDRPILVENFVDISERKRMEGLLLKSERLASIGELAGQVGHDLRNPLTGIKGGVYLLKKKDLSQETKNKTIHLIEDAIDDSNRIINSLLEYSADLRLNSSSYFLDSILSSAIKKLEVPPRIEVLKNIPTDLTVYVDYERIENAFVKLLKNAVEATPGEGFIEITGRKVESEVEISFVDSGPGIPDAILSKVFSPLTTTKAKGMGLGLAICKRIIDAHDGKISIKRNDAVNGTVVSILLPVKPKIEFMVDNNWVTDICKVSM
ncbi:MAG: PAS domain S-box protein [Candidatus Bathyarchaeia archaeon]|jgi:PAS domain S-box-containing protein